MPALDSGDNEVKDDQYEWTLVESVQVALPPVGRDDVAFPSVRKIRVQDDETQV